MELNIVDLIENNPITQLSNTYQNKLLGKIKNNFNDVEQRLFVASFYGFLNYTNTDFVIDLDNIWKWLGFSQKQRAKELLEKQFMIDKDYIILLSLQSEQKVGSGGHNKTKIMMTIKTFKSFCLKAGTKKADQIHEYYIKMEELLHEVINEECNELKLQLEEKNKQLSAQEDKLDNVQFEKELLREKTILEQFPDNVQCVYYGLIDNINSDKEPLIKFGNSNFLRNRVEQHKNTFINFRLVNAFKVENKVQIENAIKAHHVLNKYKRNLIINKVNQTELLVLTLSFEKIDELIKEIITSIEYSPENYSKLLKQYDELKIDNDRLVAALQNVLNPNDIKPPIIKSRCYTKKSPDGLYHIDGNTYKILVGTRQDVWNNLAYKTTGDLTKSELIIGTTGEVVSKAKHVGSVCSNHFIKYEKTDRYTKKCSVF